MSKLKIILSTILLSFVVCGCSCDKKEIDTYANVSNQGETVNSGKGVNLTVGNIYDYIRENGNDVISKNIMKMVMKNELDFSNSEVEELYKKYLNEKFKTSFIDSGSYDFYGEFNEALLVKYLQSEMYNISCPESYVSYLDQNYFKCDYSDYIEKELNYDIYLKMLKIKYIIEEKSNLITKSEGRLVEYYSVKKTSTTIGNDVETRKTLEEKIKTMEENYGSTDASISIKSLKDIAKIDQDAALDEITKELKYISTSDDTSFKYLTKYTTCGTKKCTIEEGEIYQRKLIMDKEYYVSKTVINTDTAILFESAREVLFGNNIEDYLYKIGDDTFLMSPAYENNGIKNINDIILYDSATSTYYVAKVKIIDGTDESSFEDKALIAEMLLDSVTEKNVFSYYFDETEIEIYDKQIREYFISKYGEY